MSSKVSRKQFLKGMAVGGTMTLAASTLAGCQKAMPSGPVPSKWDEETDVVVVGTGFAGLAAAIEAKNAGAAVKVIDKMETPGGNSIINGGDFAAPGNWYQKEQGIEDSPELMLKDMLKAGLSLNHVDRAKLLTEKALEAAEWARDYVGAEFDRLSYHGGHSVPRTVHIVNGGSGLINKMLKKLQELGVSVETQRKLERLIVNEAGRVVGIEVKDGYTFGDETSGKTIYIKAKKAVVLATGGFSRDVKMRMIHDPRLTDAFESTNHPGATGEALRAALKIGAMDVHMDWIQLGPWASPDEPGFGLVPFFCERMVGWVPMINPKTGKRFINETGNRKVRADAIIEIGEPVIIVADTYATEKNVPANVIEGGLKNGAIKKFDTLEEFAKAYDIPWDAFQAEVERWNQFVENKKDEDFGCMIFQDAKPLGFQPPFYAARLWPKVHHCMGGLVTDVNSRVIGQDFQPIPGLYAAGEVTGGIHGAVRLGGVAMADCVVFGRIAGKNAAAETPAA